MSVEKIHNTYWLETYGCQMNSAESNALEAALQEAGLKPADTAESADCAILNTCSVRKSAENRIWGRIGYFQHLKERRPMTLVVTGCMAERLGDEFLKDAPAVDHVMGTNDKQRIAALLKGGSDERDSHYSFTQSYYKEGEVSSFVPIMNGCNNFCTYCIVPYVRGREISRSIGSIYEEIQKLEDKGVREITLLGQNVNSYSYQEGSRHYHFPDLLDAIASKVSSIKWIRFESPHPKDFSSDLIEVIATHETVAKNLHIPVQSGSTHVLNLMNRKYSREQYLNLIEKIKNRISDITLTTDVMVGFPGESEVDFEQTLSLVKEIRFLDSFMYYFNPREGTKAVTMPNQLPSALRLKRLQTLIELQRSISVALRRERFRAKATILVEQVSKKSSDKLLGRTEHGEMVVFSPKKKSSPIGEFIDVSLNELVGNTYIGEPL